jgi:hypothetical protein
MSLNESKSKNALISQPLRTSHQNCLLSHRVLTADPGESIADRPESVAGHQNCLLSHREFTADRLEYQDLRLQCVARRCESSRVSRRSPGIHRGSVTNGRRSPRIGRGSPGRERETVSNRRYGVASQRECPTSRQQLAAARREGAAIAGKSSRVARTVMRVGRTQSASERQRTQVASYAMPLVEQGDPRRRDGIAVDR